MCSNYNLIRLETDLTMEYFIPKYIILDEIRRLNLLVSIANIEQDEIILLLEKKMKEKYEQIKNENKNVIVLIKSGAFYITFDEDALIMNNIFGYLIKNSKIGFPLNCLNKITNTLRTKNINYLIYDKKILYSSNFENDNYKNIMNLCRKNEYDNQNKEILISRIKYLINDKEKYNKIRSFIDEL